MGIELEPGKITLVANRYSFLPNKTLAIIEGWDVAFLAEDAHQKLLCSFRILGTLRNFKTRSSNDRWSILTESRHLGDGK